MSLHDDARKVTDQLSYNLLYAPDYPDEDQTDLVREERLLKSWIADLQGNTRREDIGDWLRLASSKIEAAFVDFHGDDGVQARREIEGAIECIRNALSMKPHRVDFVVDSRGDVQEAPD